MCVHTCRSEDVVGESVLFTKRPGPTPGPSQSWWQAPFSTCRAVFLAGLPSYFKSVSAESVKKTKSKGRDKEIGSLCVRTCDLQGGLAKLVGLP